MSTNFVGLIMMTPTATTKSSAKWFLVVLSAILFIAFFIPWVSWDKTTISGADMPNGNFFSLSESKFKLANPFPQTNFAMAILWLIPGFAIVSLLLGITNKRTSTTSIITSVLALSLATIYVLFTKVLIDLGVSHSYGIGLYLTIVAAVGIILVSSLGWLKKIIWIVIGPVLVYAGFAFATNYLNDQKHEDTANTSSSYTVNALDLIREFQTNDSLANAKYREKIVTVNGNISVLETPNDSTVNIKFIDTTGSYVIFPFLGESVSDVKKLKEGEAVSIKGSCSGGVLSEILGTESITFKRCILNK
ncbi:MAG: hypothetical protein ABIR18_10130 [Chitinophagaceae bacterium]